MRRNYRLLLSYGIDWIISVIIIIAFHLLDNVRGYWRPFSLDDKTIQYPYISDPRTPNWIVFLLAFAAPAVLMPIVNILTVRSLWDFHHSWLGLILGLALAGVVTQAAKISSGRPRPDLIARCQPISGATDAPVFGLSNASICTQADFNTLRDGFRSFPSGHSSLCFAGLGFLALYLAGKLHLFDKRGHTTKAWISVAPLLGASLVAIALTMDNKHHWQDVLVGSIIGLAFSYFAYRQYFPPLHAQHSHKCLGPRIPHDDIHNGDKDVESGLPSAEVEAREQPTVEQTTPIRKARRTQIPQ